MKNFVLLVVLIGRVGWASVPSFAQQEGGNGRAEDRGPADENQPDTTPTETEKKLREIIDALQASEKRFQNLETVVRITQQEGEQCSATNSMYPSKRTYGTPFNRENYSGSTASRCKRSIRVNA